ncbi:MAG: hypothetical protein K0Q53_1566 [Massilibacillus sp.]|jgi:FMN-dependent NADH-azoreductase|nr:hypothetical protein [Massilibacillus sp.]
MIKMIAKITSGLSWLMSTHKSQINDLKSSLHHYNSYVNDVSDNDTIVFVYIMIDFSIILGKKN